MLSLSLWAGFHVGSTEKGFRRLKDFGKRGGESVNVGREWMHKALILSSPISSAFLTRPGKKWRKDEGYPCFCFDRKKKIA